MPASKRPARVSAQDTSAAVDQFMAALQHPFKAEIETLRRAILAADSSIAEGIKWNVPSFRTTEYFATTHLRAKAGVGLVLHLGAKARELPSGGLVIADPGKLLTWLGEDRAIVEFRTTQDVENGIPALQAVLRDWIRYL